FVRKLRDRRHGLSIFEGKPGTGKTFYLRHLMGVLKESHRFYFMPTANLGVLSRPEFIGFWAEQRRSYGDRKFVVILEDSDAALLTRGTDNREQVSAILNLSDGLLADFLRLQIICTINCSSADIDPALLRPGRLLCHRVFKRLHHVQAARLAESLGKTLPTADDYSLAEIFGGNGAQGISRPRIGFAA
ncbi:MAG TPA: AAA family ATPase, partial [Verrucomicrobiae bacterium]|nr:AAA family ATPase [Verrucomicrobiae bacterium]